MAISRRMLLTAGVVALMVATPVLAHHSFAMFDNTKNTVLDGTVKEFQWSNPHSWIQLLVVDPATRQEKEWAIELGSPSTLSRTGWKRNSLKPGDKTSVVIHPLKDGTVGGSLVSASVNGVPIGTRQPEQPEYPQQ